MSVWEYPFYSTIISRIWFFASFLHIWIILIMLSSAPSLATQQISQIYDNFWPIFNWGKLSPGKKTAQSFLHRGTKKWIWKWGRSFWGGLKGMLKVGKPVQRLPSTNWESSLKDNLGKFLTANQGSLVDNATLNIWSDRHQTFAMLATQTLTKEIKATQEGCWKYH